MEALAVILGLMGIAAGVLTQVAYNSAIGSNPLMISGAIVFGAGLIAGALQQRKLE
jgi:hypothetical protein